MKKFIILLYLVFSLFSCQSQQNKSKLFILLNDKNDFELISSGTNEDLIQLFTIKELVNRVKTVIIKTDSNTIQKKTSIISDQQKLKKLTFKYVNINNNNDPILIRKSEIKNQLVYPDDFNGVEFDQLLKEIRKFDFVYIADSIYPDLYYKAKKVTLDIKAKL